MFSITIFCTSMARREKKKKPGNNNHFLDEKTAKDILFKKEFMFCLHPKKSDGCFIILKALP